MPGIICLKFFASHLNGWHHPFEIFHQPFEQLASSLRNFLSAVQTAGIIPSKFFVNLSYGWCHPFEIFLLAIQTAGIIRSKFFHSCLTVKKRIL